MKLYRNFGLEKNCFLSRPALILLHIGLPIIICEMVYLAVSFIHASKTDAVYALYLYPSMLEYIMVNLILVLLCTILLDYLYKRRSH